MSIVVEHDQRRKEILEKALGVFMEEGFENTTFQRIADRCKITRTTLYIYFKNKREIFNFSIKQLLQTVEADIIKIRSDSSLNSVEKITRVILCILKLLEQNRKLLLVVMDFILHASKNDTEPEERVRRRTLKLRHIFSSMVIEGVKSGELKELNVKVADDFLYSIIEAAIFHIVVLKKKNLQELKNMVNFAVRQFAV